MLKAVDRGASQLDALLGKQTEIRAVMKYKTPDYRSFGPAYQEYAPDMLSKREFKMMKFDERGLLYTLRLECWQNGQIPSNPEDLAAYLGKSKESVDAAFSQRVQSFFEIEDGFLISPDLERYRDSQQKRHEAQKLAAERTNAKKAQDKYDAKLNANRSDQRDAKRSVERALLEERRDEMKGDEKSRVVNKEEVKAYKDAFSDEYFGDYYPDRDEQT